MAVAYRVQPQNSEKEFNFYKNGQVWPTSGPKKSRAPPIEDPANEMVLLRNYGHAQPLKGYLGMFMIYKRALTQKEVHRIFNGDLNV